MEHVPSPVLSPDKTARKILVILVSDFNVRSGDLLPIQSASADWHQRNHRHEDFDAGLQYAIGHGWIEALPDGAGYKLTDSGFAAA